MKNINLFASTSFFSKTCVLTGIILFLALGISYAQTNGSTTAFWSNEENIRFVGDADNSGQYLGSFRFGFWNDNNVDNNPEFIIKRGGFVGINTNNPNHSLHVNGSGYVNLDLGIGEGYSTGRGRLQVNTGEYESWVAGNFGKFLGQDRVVMGLLNSKATIGAHNYALTAWSDLAINPGGGNVGIGTGSPTAKLEVAGQVKITGGTPGAGKVLTSDANGLASWATPSSNIWSTDGTHAYYTTGNIGIGTTSPSSALTVAANAPNNGVLKVVSTTHNASDQWWIGFNHSGTSTDANDRARIGVNILSGGAGRLFFTTGIGGAQAERMRIDENGNVGIGTTTPTNKLEITGGSLMLDTWETPTNGIFFRKGFDKNTGSPYNVSVTNIDWRNPSTGTGTLPDGLALSGWSGVGIITGANTYGQGGNVRLLVREDGNVGIGTTEPTKGKLHVKGSIHVENEAGDQTFHISAGKQLVFVGKDAWTQYQATLNVPNSPIQENNFSLWVSKGIVSEDYAIAKVNEWDDYVFDEAYELPTLEKVTAFVKANKHLPNIPSEAEVKQHGYSLHQLNRGFLKTIEELTLYTIEQEKKIDALEAKIAEYDQLAKEVQQLKAMMAKLKK